MPRVPPALFWRARRLAPGAALLLPVCRDLPSALAELRWIREHVDSEGRGCGDVNGRPARADDARRRRLLQLCRRRGRGEPLQYVLGTQPFGPLDLLCRRGVLIPRPEPEAYSMHLADMLLREARQTAPLTILDACTGTGCIALLLYARLKQAGRSVHAVGVDLAPAAVALARTNAVRNGLATEGSSNAIEDETSIIAEDSERSEDRKRIEDTSIRFVAGDLFADAWLAHPAVRALTGAGPLDVLVSNPPYVSADGFARDTARSVRLFEPKLAQVPGAAVGEDGTAVPEDVFYVRLLRLAARLDARIVLCEVGGLVQAERVAALAQGNEQPPPLDIEIWADHPDIADADSPQRSVSVAGRDVPVRGSGHGRSVFIRRR